MEENYKKWNYAIYKYEWGEHVHHSWNVEKRIDRFYADPVETYSNEWSELIKPYKTKEEAIEDLKKYKCVSRCNECTTGYYEMVFTVYAVVELESDCYPEYADDLNSYYDDGIWETAKLDKRFFVVRVYDGTSKLGKEVFRTESRQEAENFVKNEEKKAEENEEDITYDIDIEYE